MANSVDSDMLLGPRVCFYTISSVMLGNYLQQTTSADDISRCIFFLGALRVNPSCTNGFSHADWCIELGMVHCIFGEVILVVISKIYEPRHEISKNVVCETSTASDQPAHTRSLVRAFDSRLNIQ